MTHNSNLPTTDILNVRRKKPRIVSFVLACIALIAICCYVYIFLIPNGKLGKGDGIIIGIGIFIILFLGLNRFKEGLHFYCWLDKGLLSFQYSKMVKKTILDYEDYAQYEVSTICGYEAHSFFKKKPSILVIKTIEPDGGIMHNPPINMELLNQSEIEKLIQSLEQIIAANRKQDTI